MQQIEVLSRKTGTELLTFGFEGKDVHILPREADLWLWIAGSELYEAAGMTWNGARSIAKLPPEWVSLVPRTTLKGERDAYYLAEPAAYYQLSRSNSPPAKRLFRNIFERVLPSIRANGEFRILPPGDLLKIADKYTKCVQMMESATDVVVDAIYPLAASYAAHLRIPLPPIERFKSGQLELDGL